MGHILHEIWPFLASVFEHWQIWLSGGGLGGLIVIAATFIERFTDWKLSKKQHFVLFLVAFFLCSCFLSWVDKDDELHTSEREASKQLTNSLGLLNEVRSDYGQLRSDCAYQKGVMDTLGKQNRDQQNSINNCQTQAIGLLKPTAFQWLPLALEEAEQSPTNRKQRWILLANKDVSPAQFTYDCSRPILTATAKVVGTVADVRTVKIDQNHWGSQIRSPAWGPNSPVLITMSLEATSSENITCNFKLETGSK